MTNNPDVCTNLDSFMFDVNLIYLRRINIIGIQQRHKLVLIPFVDEELRRIYLYTLGCPEKFL